MSFQEIVTFFEDNWAIILGVSVFTIPAIWAIVNQLYKNRLAELEANNSIICRENENLKAISTQSKIDTDIDGEIPISPIAVAFPFTGPESEKDLICRLKDANQKVIIFGLTRNFFATHRMRKMLTSKSNEVAIRLYMMDPLCPSRLDRYRIEPIEASLEDPKRFEREVAVPFRNLLQKTERSPAGSEMPGLSIYYYNFPCSFAIELIDTACRVMLYGHGKRGTEGPILVFEKGNQYFDYFMSQLDWLERLASGREVAEWEAKQIKVIPFS